MSTVLKVAIYIVVAILVIAALIGFGMYGVSVVFHSDKSETASETSSDGSEGGGKEDKKKEEEEKEEKKDENPSAPISWSSGYTTQKVTGSHTKTQQTPAAPAGAMYSNNNVVGNNNFSNNRHYHFANGKAKVHIRDESSTVGKPKASEKKECFEKEVLNGPNRAILRHFLAVDGEKHCWTAPRELGKWLDREGNQSPWAAYLLHDVLKFHWTAVPEMTDRQKGFLLWDFVDAYQVHPEWWREPTDEIKLDCCGNSFNFAPRMRRAQQLFKALDESPETQKALRKELQTVWRWREVSGSLYQELVEVYDPRCFEGFPPFYVTPEAHTDEKLTPASPPAEGLPRPHGMEDPADDADAAT